MMCSILNCPNSKLGDNSSPGVTFHGFPTQKEAFIAWIEATRKPAFYPNLNSKMCSLHFEASAFDRDGNLRKTAVPTLFLDIEPMKTLEPKEDPLSCILSPSATLNKVELVHEVKNTNVPDAIQTSSVPTSIILSQTTHKVVNIVSSCRELYQTYLPPSTDTIVLNYSRNVLSNVSKPSENRAILPKIINMQGMQLMSESVSTSLSLNSLTQPIQSQATGDVEMRPTPCPIKLVDVKKLLQKPPVESDEAILPIPNKINISSSVKAEQKEIKGRRKMTPSKPPVKNTNSSPFRIAEVKSLNDNINQSVNKGVNHKGPIKVTVSQVLDCLRIILPRTFCLSRLNPSDKVAALVIKYLKLPSNRNMENQVKINLKIIIDAAKLEEKTFGDQVTHPYHKIKEVALSLALARLFPVNFSINEVSKEKLKCLCVILSQDIYVDGFQILQQKIRKYACHGIKGVETINRKTIKNNSSTSKDMVGSQRLLNETPKNTNKRKRPNDAVQEVKSIEKDLPNGPNKKPKCSSASNDSDSVIEVEVASKTEDESAIIDKKKAEEKKAKLTTNLKVIINYLELKKFSANEVLKEDKKMVNLCKYLHINNRKSNYLKLKKMLLYIVQNNLNKDNMDTIEETLNKTIKEKNENVTQGKQLSESNVECNDLTQSREVIQNDNNARKVTKDKLKLKPVVVLCDVVDFAREQLLFLGEEQRPKTIKNNNMQIPQCFTPNNSLHKYSSDHVRKLTNDSYKNFRQIVVKRFGEKIIFRLHYTKLRAGTLVFVKHFSCPPSGWLKGIVVKKSGPLMYVVKLEDGQSCSFVVDQIRPLPADQTHQPAVLDQTQSLPAVPDQIQPTPAVPDQMQSAPDQIQPLPAVHKETQQLPAVPDQIQPSPAVGKQIRPSPVVEHCVVTSRSQRQVKPKQLLNL